MIRNLRLSGGRQKTSSEYLLADGTMGVIKMPSSQLNICWYPVWYDQHPTPNLDLGCPSCLFSDGLIHVRYHPSWGDPGELHIRNTGSLALSTGPSLLVMIWYLYKLFSLLPSTLPTWWPPQWQLTYSCRSSTGCAPLACISELDLWSWICFHI